MRYREIIAVCSQIHRKHINTVCGQNAALCEVIKPNHKDFSGEPNRLINGIIKRTAALRTIIWCYDTEGQSAPTAGVMIGRDLEGCATCRLLCVICDTWWLEQVCEWLKGAY